MRSTSACLKMAALLALICMSNASAGEERDGDSTCAGGSGAGGGECKGGGAGGRGGGGGGGEGGGTKELGGRDISCPAGPNWNNTKNKYDMYLHGNDRNFTEMLDIFQEESPCSVVVAYHGCKLVGYLSGHDKEERGDETRETLASLGAVAAVTAAMGRHLTRTRVLAMGCFAIQALSDGHEKHTRMVIESGGAQVVAHILRAAGRDAEIAEYCVAAIATLSLDSEGSRLLGDAGAVEGVWRTMSAHLETAKPEVQAYGCASLLRMTNNQENVRRLVGNQDAVKAVVDAMRKHIKVPLVLQTCGRLVKAPNANTGDERSLPPGSV